MAGSTRALDSLDVRILATVQARGRITVTDLAETVGLSASPCLARLRRLEHDGVIAGYRADIDLRRLGNPLHVFAEVTLADHDAGAFLRFERHVRAVPEIVEAHKLGGGFDYLLRFCCPDMAAYQSLSDALLGADLGIDKFFSYFLIDTVKAFTGWPLPSVAK